MYVISFILFLFIIPKEVYTICKGGTYLNICGYCVGGPSGLNEKNGLDRCNVCSGNNSCVGCDGLVYSDFTIDACGLCKSRTDPQWNDCLVITNIYPNIIDRALKNNIVALSVRGAGLSAENIVLAEPKCQFAAVGVQTVVPVILETSAEASDIELKVEVGQSLGLYKVKCDKVDGEASLRVTNSLNWNALSVIPTELHVDNTYRMELNVGGEQIGIGPVWCFLRCNGTMTRVKIGEWLNGTRVKCHDITPKLAAWCQVGVSATEQAAEYEESTGAAVVISVKTAAPFILSAELNQDLAKLVIRFSENIQITADCDDIFSSQSKLSLLTSRCVVSGDILAVALQPEAPLLSVVEILKGNGVRRMGTNSSILAPECQPVVVSVSLQKVLPPNLSLFVPSVLCHGSEEFRISSIGNQKLKYMWSVPPPSIRPGTQRENLLTWQNVRHLQSELNEEKSGSLRIDAAHELLENAAYNFQVRGTNVLGEQQSVSSSLIFSPSAPITVTVTAPPAVTAILAEVNITLCHPLSSPLSLQWLLNNTYQPAAGRVVLFPNLKPGHYNVSCVVSLYSTSEVLATGWVLTQVLPTEEKVLLSPAEQVVGTMDSISIRAFSLYDVAGVWRCYTPDLSPCVAPGPNPRIVDQIITNNVTVLNIPPGTLAVGRYEWVLENLAGTKSVVVVVAGIPPRLEVSLVPPLVNPTSDLELKGEASRLQVDCSLRWTTVYSVGFNYFNLQDDVGLGDTLTILPDDGLTADLPLFVPSAQGHWEGLMSETSYLVRFVASCPGSESNVAHIDVPITVNVPPIVSPLTISGLDGTALMTQFTVDGGSSTDVYNDYPLKFVWAFNDEADTIRLKIGNSQRSIQFLLPPGKVKMILEVCDVHATCTKVNTPVLAVVPPLSMPSSVITDVNKEMSELIVEGSTIEGFGKAVVAVKTLNAMMNSKMTADAALDQKQLQLVTDTIDDAISARCTHLTIGYSMNPSLAIVGLQFLSDVLAYRMFLPPSQLTLELLVELKDTITPMPATRIKRHITKRDALPDSASTAIETEIAYFNSTKDNTRVLNEVHKFIKINCHEKDYKPVDAGLVDFKLFSLLKNESSYENSAKVLFLNPRSASCLAIANFDSQVFPLTNTNFSILSNVFEVEVIINGDIQNQTTSADSMMKITIPIKTKGEGMKCARWINNSWSHLNHSLDPKGQFMCEFRDFGYFAIVGKKIEVVEVSTSSTTTTTTTQTPSLNSSEIVETTLPDIPVIDVTTEKISTGQRAKLISYGGGQFNIDEKFEDIVGDNPDEFRKEILTQISNTFNINPDNIAIVIKKGSIVVTVYFLESMEESEAKTVVGQLEKYLYEGSLKLNSHGQSLNVPKQNLTIIYPPPYDQQAATIRLATFIVVGILIVLVMFIIILAARGEPRNELLARNMNLEECAPQYLDFSKDPSLDGSSVSLAQYRKPFIMTMSKQI